MSYLDELKPGKRENAFYIKSGVLQHENNYSEKQSKVPKKVYVYEWDKEKKKHIGHLVDTIEYYKKYGIELKEPF